MSLYFLLRSDARVASDNMQHEDCMNVEFGACDVGMNDLELTAAKRSGQRGHM